MAYFTQEQQITLICMLKKCTLSTIQVAVTNWCQKLNRQPACWVTSYSCTGRS